MTSAAGDEVLGLRRLQAASGLLFSLFLTLHLLTTASASTGLGAYDATLATLRAIYRPVVIVEVALVAVPALVHIYCAARVILHRRRAKQPAPKAWHTRLHRWSGWFLLMAFFGHVFATRFAPLLGDGATATGRADFSFLAFSLLSYPTFFRVYYLLLGAAGGLHLGLGAALAAKLLWPARVKTKRALAVGGAVAAMLALAAVVGVGAMIRHADHADRARFPEFRALYHRLAPFLTLEADSPSTKP
jgi:succinate dehydrogenase/fumarate reductase cytochrome b subunit